MKSSVTNRFRKLLSLLPLDVQRQADRAFNLWRTDPYRNSLQFKRVNAREGVYSVRVGIGHRALGILEDDFISWYWIGTHAEYDEILRRL
ncbi:MAG: hypothetical protein AAB353_02890 [Candidatus Hydrogenedentota bacterium]